MVLGLYTHDRCRNAKNRKVMSFLSQNLCETAVLGPLSFSQSTSSLDYYTVDTKQASRASRTDHVRSLHDQFDSIIVSQIVEVNKLDFGRTSSMLWLTPVENSLNNTAIDFTHLRSAALATFSVDIKQISRVGQALFLQIRYEN